jgi:hypothetical protein
MRRIKGFLLIKKKWRVPKGCFYYFICFSDLSMPSLRK